MNPLTTALSNIRRSPYQAIVAILTMTVTFAVLFALSFFYTGAQIVLNHYERQPQIIAYFTIEATSENIASAEEIMAKKPYVENVSITSKEEALQLYSKEFRDSPLLLELVSAEILPASIEVRAKTIAQLAQVKDDLATLPGIENVDYQESVIDSLKSATNSTRTVGLGAAIILLILSFLVIIVIIGMRVSMQKRTISIMRLLGATRWYVKRPFMLEGMAYGFTGALFGWGVSMAGLLYILPTAEKFFVQVPLFPIPLVFYAVQLGVGLLFGVFLGIFAGYIAASRLIKN